MELSLLREATFILGTTAFTNSFIIALFLGGLAAGCYIGNVLVRATKGRSRMLFLVSQGANIAVIVTFVLTKNLILYGDVIHLGQLGTAIILSYFAAATLGPALAAGMSFSLFVHMIYDYGERYIALV